MIVFMYIRQREPAKIVSKEWKLTIVFLRGLNVVSPDGNGRTGRMLLNLQLLREGWLPINIKKNESGKYYRCFRQFDISREKGIQEMFNLITKYEYEELLKLRSLIEKDLKKIK